MKRLRVERQAQFMEAVEKIASELEYAYELWEDERPALSLPDDMKPLECWLTWARQEIKQAEAKAYKSYDKAEAMDHVRKSAGHLVRAMMYFADVTEGRE